MRICKKLLNEIASKYNFELGDNPIKSIHDNSSKIDWTGLSCKFILSEDFIREFKDKVYWVGISYQQQLSESFIREFQDKVDWHNITRKQILSEDFIKEFRYLPYY
jgi:hypothetical protein